MFLAETWIPSSVTWGRYYCRCVGACLPIFLVLKHVLGVFSYHSYYLLDDCTGLYFESRCVGCASFLDRPIMYGYVLSIYFRVLRKLSAVVGAAQHSTFCSLLCGLCVITSMFRSPDHG